MPVDVLYDIQGKNVFDKLRKLMRIMCHDLIEASLFDLQGIGT